MIKYKNIEQNRHSSLFPKKGGTLFSTHILLTLWLAFSFSLLSMGQSTTVRVALIGDACSGSVLRFEASVNSGVAYSCRWWKVGILRDIPLTGNSRTYSIASASSAHNGQYYCIITETDSGKETVSDKITLDVRPLIVCLPSGIPGICQDEKIPLDARDGEGNLIPSGDLTWSYGTLSQWQSNTATTLPEGSGGNPFLLSGKEGDMLVRVQYRMGTCTGIDSLSVRVKPSRYYWGGGDDGYVRVSSAFRVEVNTPLERDYCEGEPLRLKITAISEIGGGNFRYRWLHLIGGNGVEVGQDSALWLRPARITDAGAYLCEVTDENGFIVNSDTQNLYYKPLRLNVVPGIAYAGEGETITVSALTASGDTLSGDSLQWFKGSLPLSPSADNGKYLHYTAGATDEYITAVFTNSKGCVARDSLQLVTKSHILSKGGVEDGFAKVGAGFTVERVLPSGKIEEYCPGDQVVLKARVTGEDNSNYRFRWWKVNKPSDRLVGSADSLILPTRSSADAGVYYCEAQDANGYISYTDSLQLVVHTVDLSSIYYAVALEQLSYTALNAKGEPAAAPLSWFERVEGDLAYIPLPSTGNPLHYTAGSAETMLKVVSHPSENCYAEDSTRIVVRNNSIFRGTQGDGFDATVVPASIVRPYLPSMLCSASDSISLQVTADGSDLNYRWQIREGGEWKDLSDSSLSYPYRIAGAGTSLLHLASLPQDYKGAFRCAVSNSLNTVYSAVITVYGHHLLEASVTPEIVRMGDEGGSAAITVRLEHGIAPWNYRYSTPRGVTRMRNSLNDSTDLFSVNDFGLYPLLSLSDSLGCEVIDSLPVVEVTTYKIPEITISGDNEVCPGTNVNLLLSVREGVGPWEIIINKDGIPAVDLGLTFPLRLTARDTSIWFYAYSEGIYTVDTITDLNNGKSSWGGITLGSAGISLKETDDLRFVLLADNHVGTCSATDLFALLRPTANGIECTDGTFYANGFPVSPFWTAEVGDQTIRYVQQPNASGCAAQREVLLTGDALPVVEMTTPGMLCGEDQADVVFTFSGNGVNFSLQQLRMSTLASGGGMNETTRTLSFESSRTSYQETVRFLDRDSSLTYKIKDISDKYGCPPSVNTEISGTVYHHLRPELQLNSRYPDKDGRPWTDAPGRLYTWGDNVGLQGQVLSGEESTLSSLMSYPGGYPLPFIPGRTYTVSQSGTYTFSVKDAYCENKEERQLTIAYATNGYLRMKVLLEGNVAAERDLLVELLRDGVVAGYDSCLVSASGIVTNSSGSSVLELRDFCKNGILPVDGTYTLRLSSFGYLTIRSFESVSFSIESGKARLIDFTDASSVEAVSGDIVNHMSFLGTEDGKPAWGMSAVDTQHNELITVRDGNEVKKAEAESRVTGEENVNMTRKNRDKFN